MDDLTEVNRTIFSQDEEARAQTQMHAEMDRSKKSMEEGKLILKRMR